MRRTNSKRSKRGGKRWSGRVTRESDALTLEKGVFTKSSPRKIAVSLKRSADQPAAQVEFLSLGNVDAHLLHQSGRQRFVQEPETEAGKGEGRAARALRQG
jgi:Protein of unknown function (DUF3175)